MTISKIVIAATGIFAALSFSCLTAASQEWRSFRALCGERVEALSHLSDARQQFSHLQGVTHADQFAQLFADNEGHWTFVVTIGRETCFVASGTNLEIAPPTAVEGSES